MNQLPLPEELIALIVEYACVDDGTTARSLLSASKQLMRIVTPIQWHSLALSGAGQFCGFAHALSRVSERPIYHLFISDRVASNARHFWTPSRVSRDGTGTIEELHSKEERERIQWRNAQSFILERAAPTLQTLTFLVFDPRNSARRVGDMLKQTYPNLRELTIRVPPLQPLFASDPIDLSTIGGNAGFVATFGNSKAHLLPRLERLHIAGHYKTSTSAPSRIGSISSGVTHLRLSGIFAYPFTRELAAELFARGVLDQDVLVGNPVAHAPPHFVPESVELLVLQPSTPDYSNSWGTDHGDSAIQLMGAFEAAARIGTQVLYLPPMVHGYYGYDQAKVDWLDRIGGGAGCWVPQEEVVVPAEADPSSENLQSSHGGSMRAPSAGSGMQGYIPSFLNVFLGRW
ncbi:hypothetical protein OE88DRAFT_1387673 [Heliocybe sulcata]|uniref:Uncharacterized protein n=1 Tax=Heliocybe sulcata TaxID=5364 RepID=A0A5C3N783_9AGAM|nr:hypothetical protein OE88DRAFT_1387673 [Heliocybe sulcata]